jgi:hypothetical protein
MENSKPRTIIKARSVGLRGVGGDVGVGVRVGEEDGFTVTVAVQVTWSG